MKREKLSKCDENMYRKIENTIHINYNDTHNFYLKTIICSKLWFFDCHSTFVLLFFISTHMWHACGICCEYVICSILSTCNGIKFNWKWNWKANFAMMLKKKLKENATFMSAVKERWKLNQQMHRGDSGIVVSPFEIGIRCNVQPARQAARHAFV